MLVAVRKVMEKFFTKHELEVLDDLMPETIKKKKLNESMADGIEGDAPCEGSESGEVKPTLFFFFIQFFSLSQFCVLRRTRSMVKRRRLLKPTDLLRSKYQ